MLTYNVTINVDDSIHNKWLKWITSKHIPDVISTKCFTKYIMYRLLSPSPEEGTSYVIQYFCKNIEDYERYQLKHAAILQNEHKEKFDGKFTAIRSLMEEV